MSVRPPSVRGVRMTQRCRMCASRPVAGTDLCDGHLDCVCRRCGRACAKSIDRKTGKVIHEDSSPYFYTISLCMPCVEEIAVELTGGPVPHETGWLRNLGIAVISQAFRDAAQRVTQTACTEALKKARAASAKKKREDAQRLFTTATRLRSEFREKESARQFLMGGSPCNRSNRAFWFAVAGRDVPTTAEVLSAISNTRGAA